VHGWVRAWTQGGGEVIEAWLWTEEAGRARRSERARAMRLGRGFGGKRGRGGGERGGDKGTDAGVGLGQCNVRVHVHELEDDGVKREEALLTRDRCRGGVGGGVGSWGKAAPVPCVDHRGRPRERRCPRTEPVPCPRAACNSRCGRVPAGADEGASVSDGGAGGKGTGMGRKGRRRDRVGVGHARAGGRGPEQRKDCHPDATGWAQSGCSASRARWEEESRVDLPHLSRSLAPRAELGAPRVSGGAHSALAIAGTSSDTRRGAEGRPGVGGRTRRELGKGGGGGRLSGGWGGRPWGGLRPFPAARLPIPSRRIRGPSGGGVNYFGGGVTVLLLWRRSWARRTAGRVRTGRMSPSHASGTGQGDLTPTPRLFGARTRAWVGIGPNILLPFRLDAQLSHRSAKRGRGEQRSRR
jgi:hypothetical protein